MKSLSWAPLSAAGVVFALACALAPACTTHGEGGRCDHTNVVNNQYADCDNGLVCLPGNELALPDGGGAPKGDFCCPGDPNVRAALPTSDICHGAGNAPNSDASIPDGALETGAGDATSDQSTSDVVTDAPSEAATDAGDDGASADAAGD